jgi:hypothetical protein
MQDWAAACLEAEKYCRLMAKAGGHAHQGTFDRLRLTHPKAHGWVPFPGLSQCRRRWRVFMARGLGSSPRLRDAPRDRRAPIEEYRPHASFSW